jgi:predicted ABC-type ATPase
MSEVPTIYVLAGPNGAGKTTFAHNYLLSEVSCPVFLNADYLAKGLSPLEPELAALRAGKLMLQEFDRLVKERSTFALETTLSGITLAERLRAAQAQGYRLVLYYLWLPSVKLSKERVKLRVSKGGHNIPEQDIERRFARSLENLRTLYLPMADEWSLVKSYTTPPQYIATCNGEKLAITDPALYRLLTGHD